MNERFAKERAETDALKREALQLGIEIPPHSTWWWDDMENFGGSLEQWEYVRDDFTYLTDVGQAGVKKLIRDEQAVIRDRKILWACQIIAAVTGLAGAAIGILAMIFSMMRT
jgi:hypothetical protein